MISGFIHDGVITVEKPTSSAQVSCISSGSSENNSDIDDSLSAYEKAGMKRKEEYCQLLITLGLLKVARLSYTYKCVPVTTKYT